MSFLCDVVWIGVKTVCKARDVRLDEKGKL